MQELIYLRKTNQEWLDIIQQCRTSGLSDRQWCIENDVNFSTFYYHIRRLRSKACEIPESIKTNSSSQQEIVPVSFAEESLPNTTVHKNSDTAVHIRYRDFQVKIHENANKELIFNTLGALQTIC